MSIVSLVVSRDSAVAKASKQEAGLAGFEPATHGPETLCAHL